MGEQPKKLLQWHAAFYADIQIELEDESENLLFENEHMLGTKPMQTDVLITKKNAQKGIRKNIGQIFRKYNLIEYKSPMDYISINDFYKVLGYAYFFMADTVHVNEIKSEELSLSFVCSKYPKKLFKSNARETWRAILVSFADIFRTESLRILAERLSWKEIGLPPRLTCYHSPPIEVGVSSHSKMRRIVCEYYTKKRLPWLCRLYRKNQAPRDLVSLRQF